jgi:hypothetical protein
MGLRFEGLEEFRAAFQRVKDRGSETIDGSVRKHMEEDVLPETKRRVPKKTFALADTGHVEPGEKVGSHKVVYGDSSVNNDSMVDYAAAVHEITKARHAPPTGAKFVEEPLKESVERLAERTAKALDDLAQG